MTFRLAPLKNISLSAILLASVHISFSKDFYWIGNSGNWEDASHWSLNSGGNVAGELPGSTDKVIFDDQSFSFFFPVIQLNNDIEISEIQINTKYYPLIQGNNIEFSVNTAFNASGKFGIQLADNGVLRFANSGNQTGSINTFGIKIKSNIAIEGSWNLTNHLLADETAKINLNSGKIKLNGYTIYAGEISAKKNQVDVDFSASYIYAHNLLDLKMASNIGGHANFRITDGEFISGQMSGFSGSSWEKVTVICPNPPFQLDLNVTSDYNGENISCNDSCDGELTIVASGTPGPFSYSFNSGFGPWTSQTVYPNLCAGNYTITVIDSSQQIVPGLFAQCSIDDSRRRRRRKRKTGAEKRAQH